MKTVNLNNREDLLINCNGFYGVYLHKTSKKKKKIINNNWFSLDLRLLGFIPGFMFPKTTKRAL